MNFVYKKIIKLKQKIRKLSIQMSIQSIKIKKTELNEKTEKQSSKPHYENPKLKKEISKSKKYDKNIKSDLKTDDIRQGINNEKSFLTEVDITIEQPNSIEKNYEQNFQHIKKFDSKILSK